VSQDDTGQAHVAEISTQETGEYAPEDKIRIVLEGSVGRSPSVTSVGGRGSNRASSMPGPKSPWKQVKSVSPGIRSEMPPARRSNT